MQIWSIILAAGRSTRLGPESAKKQFLHWRSRPLFWHCARVFASAAPLRGALFVFPPENLPECKDWVESTVSREGLGLERAYAPGGERRQDSVASGLRCLPRECTHVLIHDSARPFLSAELIQRVIASLEEGSTGVVPGLPVTDTIKMQEGEWLRTLPREKLYAVQTPQGFNKEALLRAHEEAEAEGVDATDDSLLLERRGHKIALVPGQEKNMKITHQEDLEQLREESGTSLPCTGWGYDVHRYREGSGMRLGGVDIPEGPAIEAHSDGDAALHAIVDALLGCLGRGDIGDHFPDSDPRFKGIHSTILLKETLAMAREDGIRLTHLDLTLICQYPRLGPWKESIKRNLANLTGLEAGQVNVKACTEEGLGFTGQGKGIKAVAQITGIRSLREQNLV